MFPRVPSLQPWPQSAAAPDGTADATPARPDNPPPPEFALQSEFLVRAIRRDILIRPSARGATAQSEPRHKETPPAPEFPLPPADALSSFRILRASIVPAC